MNTKMATGMGFGLLLSKNDLPQGMDEQKYRYHDSYHATVEAQKAQAGKTMFKRVCARVGSWFGGSGT